MGQEVLRAFGLTLFAGLATGIGSLIALFAKRTNFGLLAASLGLSAGVMIYISFMELLGRAQVDLSATYGDRLGTTYAILAFLGGIAIIMALDFLIPEEENPHEVHMVEDMKHPDAMPDTSRLHRVGFLSALILALHNLPEGMVTFLTALNEFSLAIPIAIAIAIHNIPEGISVAVPIYYATGDRSRAFWISFLSGLAEPVGALLGYFILRPFITPELISIINAGIAGVMVFISLDELLPAAQQYGKHHHAIVGVVVGMAVMAFTLVLL